MVRSLDTKERGVKGEYERVLRFVHYSKYMSCVEIGREVTTDLLRKSPQQEGQIDEAKSM
jgi:hypothetical protein